MITCYPFLLSVSGYSLQFNIATVENNVGEKYLECKRVLMSLLLQCAGTMALVYLVSQ